MYELISAIAKPLNSDGKWVSVDIAAVPMKTLYTTYSRVIATLTNPFLPDLVALDLADVAQSQAGRSITFSAFLIANGSNTLPTSPQLQLIAPKYAKYADAFHAGYKVAPQHPTAAPGSQYPAAEMTWLYLTRPETDYELFARSCLVSVNGFYHLLDSGPHGVFIKDGNKSAQLSRQNQIGITSFREVGALTYVPITAEMLYLQDPGQSYANRCYVNIGQDVSSKSVLLVLGGYLHVLDGQSFYRVSDSSFGINIGNIPLLDRFFESEPYLDLSSLPLDRTGRNRQQIAVSQLYSNASLAAYLTLSQSFFVILDNPDIFVEYEAVRKTLLPNLFISHVPPTWPLVVGAGKVGNYWYTQEDGQYALTCHDSLYQQRLYNTVNPKLQANVSAQRDPRQPERQSNAVYLKVGTQLTPGSMTRQQWLDSQSGPI